jgi:hypothetical protein
MEKKIEYLNNAISDAQELIRFTDTKTAVVITLIAAYIAAIFSSAEKITQYFSAYSCCFWFFFILCIVLIIICISISVRIIKPTNNPTENIDLPVGHNPKLHFYIFPNDYKSSIFYPFINSKKFKLNGKLDVYITAINDATDSDIIDSLSFELFKVNYIRNVKNDRFKVLLWFILGLTTSFLIYFIIYNIETQHAISVLAKLRHRCC